MLKRSAWRPGVGGWCLEGSQVVRFFVHLLAVCGLVGSITVCMSVHALAPDKAFHQYVRDTWSIEEGLPQISVMAVVQGPDGYIWAGTQAGVARFDGVRFVNFDPGTSPHMPGMFIQTLYVDSRDRIWAGTYKGAAVFRDGEFHGVDDGFGREIDVFQFAETVDGELLMAADRGLFRLAGGAFVQFAGDPDDRLLSVYQHRGTVYAGGFGVIHINTGESWQRTALPDALSNALVNDFEAHDGTIWAATTRGLLWLDDGQWQPFVVPGRLEDAVIETVYADRDGNFWIGAAGFLFRLQGRELVETIADDSPSSHGSVLDITEDHEGNLWLGSRWDGLARLWNGWVFRYDRPEGLHNSLVWSVARDAAGDVWTGTMDGLAVFRDGRFTQLTRGSEQPHPHAYTLLPEEDRVWVGTRTGLFWWNRELQRIDKPAGFAPLDSAQVNGIIRRRDGSYWIASTEGVFRWDGTRMERAAARGDLGGQDIRVLAETRDGKLLAGTRRGLIRWGAGDRFYQVPGAAEQQDVTALLELSDGRLVLGTLNERLFIGRGDQWHELGVEDGLPVNSPFALAEHEGRLWVAGIRGIHELSLADVDRYLAGEIDSLPGRMVLHERGDVPGAQKGYCCNGAGNAKGFMHDGEFWLPTRGGIVHLVPERIRRNEAAPRVRIDRFRNSEGWHALSSGDLQVFPSGERDLAFGFAVLSFQDATGVTAEYRLRGFREQWQSLDEPMRREVIYTNLPAGEFTLQVRATNNAGVWNTAPTELTFRIEPRFWETNWFRVVSLFGVLLLIWLLFNFRLRNMQHQQRALERTVSERTDELRVANEHLRDYSARLETASLTDPLTRLWNRRYLGNQLVADLAYFHRQLSRPSMHGHAMVFALIDIDFFKQVNDRHGHAAGDEVLDQFARLLEDLTRTGDYVVRWGGEEFLIVFRPLPEREIPRLCARIVDGVREKPFALASGETLKMTCSVGVCAYPPFRDKPGAFDWEQTIALADKALYHIKRDSRDNWCWIRPTSRVEPATLSQRLTVEIGDLLAAGEIEIDTG